MKMKFHHQYKITLQLTKTLALLFAIALLYNCNYNKPALPDNSGYAIVNDHSLYYHKYGTGQPILVMHGGLGLDHHYLRSLDGLGNVAQLIYYDHLGNGQSAIPENWDTINFESLSRDAKNLMLALGHSKFILYGHSYGGFIAQEYATRYPETLTGLILSNATPNIKDYHAEMPSWATKDAISTFGQLFSAPMTSDKLWKDTWFKVLPLYWKDMDASLAEKVHNKTHYRADAWNRGLQLLGNFEMKGRLKQVNIPTLVLGGSHDFVTPIAGQNDIANELPNARMVEFKNSAHFPMFTEKSLYLTTIKNWITSH